MISAAAQGWRLSIPGSLSAQFEPRIVQSLAEAAEAAPLHCPIHLALPVSAVMFERMTLPATDPDELRGMMRLQLEKTLPYPVDEVTSDYAAIQTGEKESVVMAVALSNVQLDLLCAPLRAAGRFPEKITVRAMHLAATCPVSAVVLLIYKEEGKFIIAICENGNLGFVHTLAATEIGEVTAELPQVLLSAELDGVPSDFSRIQLDRECAEIKDKTSALLGLPVDVISTEEQVAGPNINLFPSIWQGVITAAEQRAKAKSFLILAAGVYLAIVLCASGYLFWMTSRVATLDKALRAIQPEVASIQARSTRWNSLAPVLDPGRYTVELLYQIQKSLPSDSIRITEFDQSFDQVNSQFTIKGEAPTPALAIDFGEQLKNNPDLKDFRIEVPAPALLPNSEHAQFEIFGKL